MIFYWNTKTYNKDSTKENQTYQPNNNQTHSTLSNEIPKTPSATTWVFQAFKNHFFHIKYPEKISYFKNNVNSFLYKNQFNSTIKTNSNTPNPKINILKITEDEKNDLMKIEKDINKEFKKNVQISVSKTVTQNQQNSILKTPKSNSIRKTVSFYENSNHINDLYCSGKETNLSKKFPGNFPSPYIPKLQSFKTDQTYLNIKSSNDSETVVLNSKKLTNIICQQIDSLSQNNQKLKFLVSEICEEQETTHNSLKSNSSEFDITIDLKNSMSFKYWKTKFETLNVIKRDLENEVQFWKSRCSYLEKQLYKLSKISSTFSKKNTKNNLFIEEPEKNKKLINDSLEGDLLNIKENLVNIQKNKSQLIKKSYTHPIFLNPNEITQLEESEKKKVSDFKSLNNQHYLSKNEISKNLNIDIDINQYELEKKGRQSPNIYSIYLYHQGKYKNSNTIFILNDMSHIKIKNKNINQNSLKPYSGSKISYEIANLNNFAKDTPNKEYNSKLIIDDMSRSLSNFRQLKEITNETKKGSQSTTKSFPNLFESITRKEAAAKRLEERRKHRSELYKAKQNKIGKENVISL
ncbi:unnamed protein product [Pneumocystis jirovecii]|uniref:Spindle pole body-associated protein cut12 domain-containing protein n=2 Tax=Pneumocystis jirovecii TaxID=42068 RepID=L0PC58_PNEJI|nr:uncharacterized protein T551_01285 [Pneumocystis jirovecii RU7]KTW31212.1 hypothetical protein T551_01285 [Pneumocystis jirovecii RU7]CCJ29956.1 unnamed protein product [Pneumocystis jirovecii]